MIAAARTMTMALKSPVANSLGEDTEATHYRLAAISSTLQAVGDSGSFSKVDVTAAVSRARSMSMAEVRLPFSRFSTLKNSCRL